MTCIVAIKDKENMYMASDKMITTESGTKDICRLKKIFKPKSNILIGTSGSVRFGQCLEFLVDYKDIEDVDEMTYLIKYIIPSILKAMDDNFIDFQDTGTSIFCIKGRIFEVDSGFGIVEPDRDYTSIGSGSDIAKGSLFSTESKVASKRIKEAIKASSCFIKSVSEEYDILKYKII